MLRSLAVTLQLGLLISHGGDLDLCFAPRLKKINSVFAAQVSGRFVSSNVEEHPLVSKIRGGDKVIHSNMRLWILDLGASHTAIAKRRNSQSVA
uniref:Peptidase A2 domain-containing protein n=1 Tax=Megaselia scalaris TaxID=36166 RepID=T1GVL1_MEGSC